MFNIWMMMIMVVVLIEISIYEKPTSTYVCTYFLFLTSKTQKMINSMKMEMRMRIII